MNSTTLTSRLNPAGSSGTAGRAEEIAATMRKSLATWVALVVVAGGGIGTVIATAGGGRVAEEPGALFWAAAGMFCVGIPLAWRWHLGCYRRAWRQGVVTPRGYWRASLAIWLAPAVTVVLACLAALQSASLIREMMLALPAFILLVLSFPTDWAMTHPTASARDEDTTDENDLLHGPPGS